ncbi:hypothetical protein LCGC14_2543560, partial [marine sediment metagenome]
TYEDPETHEKYKDVLAGGALTNRPYFKQLKAVVASKLTFKQGDMDLKLEDILEKEATDLEDNEVEFLKEHKDELSDEQKETYKDVLEEGAGGGAGDPGGGGDPSGEKSKLEKVLEKDRGDLTDEEVAQFTTKIEQTRDIAQGV